MFRASCFLGIQTSDILVGKLLADVGTSGILRSTSGGRPQKSFRRVQLTVNQGIKLLIQQSPSIQHLSGSLPRQSSPAPSLIDCVPTEW